MQLKSEIASDRIKGLVEAAFQSQLLPREGNLFVAVSGGQDSLALLHAIAAAKPPAVNVFAAHVDHGIQASSRSDALSVASTARSLGVKPIVRRYPVATWSQRQGINLESAARSVRYRLLADVAASRGGGPIVTGHTGDDLAETVLLHLLRGAGLDGLVGLHTRQSLSMSALEPTPPRLGYVTGLLTILRPLLDAKRQETAAYCEMHGLSWIVDRSNADTAFVRNRIRHHLLPLLETYNPSIRESIRRLSAVVRDDAMLIETMVDREWAAQASVDNDSVRFRRSAFLAVHRAVSSRLLRRAATRMMENGSLSFDQIDRCLDLVVRGSGSTMLSGALEWIVSTESLELRRQPADGSSTKSRRRPRR